MAPLLKVENAKHAYEVEVNKKGEFVRVHAHNRDQAARLAKKAGYEVRSVNLVG